MKKSCCFFEEGEFPRPATETVQNKASPGTESNSFPLATKPGEQKKGHRKRQRKLDQPNISGFISLGRVH